MPLARTAFAGPWRKSTYSSMAGSEHNTKNITRFIAVESRSYVISGSGLMKIENFPENTPHIETILKMAPKVLVNGGSCIAGPDGKDSGARGEQRRSDNPVLKYRPGIGGAS